MREYNVGDKVWWAKYERQEVKKTCPICFGKLRVRLILGDDSQIETDCTYCERGFQQYGYVIEYEYVSAVELVEIDTKEVNEDGNGRQVEYRYNHYCLDDKNTFENREEAEEALKEIIAKVEKDDLERLEYGKDQNPRKYSWHIGYYQRKKRDALKEIEFADKKIAYFKSKPTPTEDKTPKKQLESNK